MPGEIRLLASLFRQESQSGGPLGEPVRLHRVDLDPVSEEVVNVLPRRRCLERTGTSV